MPRNTSSEFLLRTASYSLVTLASALCVPGTSWAADSDVRVSSIGYVTGRAKRASIVGAKAGTTFEVKHDDDGTVALRGTVIAPVNSDETGESVAILDFSSLDDEGRFYLDVAGVGRSISFPIGGRAFQDPFLASMLGFYGWRCGTAVSLTFHDTTFEHAACHTDDGHTDYLGSEGRRDGAKGWHDAGDYGKYVVNAGVTVGAMLAAWEQFPSALSRIALPIPENGGKTPDYLDEIRWELEWLLTMQYSETDARVSHKLTSIDFDAKNSGWVMPESDRQIRYFVPWGSAATADFVAILAKGARAYASYDAAFAQRCLDAATRSYAYLRDDSADTDPDQSAFKTGAYTTPDSDDRLWAAAEMWESTGDGAALADFEKRAKAATTKVLADFDWSDVTNLGMFTYILSHRPGRDPSLVSEIRNGTVAAADELVSHRAAHPYGRALTKYYWGANGSVARSCMVLQTANLLSPSADYLDTCVEQIGWLFGRNYYNRSFVTGVGKDPPMHPHHRPSASDGIEDPWPGLLVGGGHPTAKDWVDEQANYKVNEVAINWNAGLVYALAGFLPSGDAVWPADTGSAPAGSGGSTGHGSPADANGGSETSAGGAGGAAGSAGAANEETAPATAGSATHVPDDKRRTGCSCRVGEGARPAGAGILLGGLTVMSMLLGRRRGRDVPGAPRHECLGSSIRWNGA